MNFNILEILGFVFLAIICYFAFMWTIGRVKFKAEDVTLVERDGKMHRLGTFTELVEAVQALANYNPPRESPEGVLLLDLVHAIDKFKKTKIAKMMEEQQQERQDG